jgi:hypothetical protein
MNTPTQNPSSDLNRPASSIGSPSPDWVARRAALREQEWTLAQECFAVAGSHFKRLLEPNAPKGLAIEAVRLFATAIKHARLAIEAGAVSGSPATPGGIPALPPAVVAAIDKIYGPSESSSASSTTVPPQPAPSSAPPAEAPAPPAAASLESTPSPSPTPAASTASPPVVPRRMVRPRLNHNLTLLDRAPTQSAPPAVDSRSQASALPPPPSAAPGPEPERPDVTPVPLIRGLPVLKDLPSVSAPTNPALHNEFYLWASVEDVCPIPQTS